MIGMKITKEITREHMDTYLTIMVTVLVATQVICIAQNTIQLHRQNKLIKKEIAHLGDVTQEDFDNQRKAYKLAIEYFEKANIGAKER